MNKKRKGGRAAMVMAAVVGLAGIASCGGGEQKETFQAQRIIVFGDENSLINNPATQPGNTAPAGSKYTVNALKSDGVTPDCALNVLWVQVVASHYGVVFAECNPNNVAVTRGSIKAQYGATVAMTRAQVEAMVPLDEQNPARFAKGDLITLMAGTNDVLQLMNRWENRATDPNLSALSDEAAAAFLIGEAGKAGTSMGNLAVSAARKDAKVLIAKIPSMLQTPYAGLPGKNTALLNSLSVEFNNRLGSALASDPNGGGRSGALLATDDEVDRFNRVPASYGFVDVLHAACVSTQAGNPPMDAQNLPQQCTSTTAQAGSTAWLWAGATQLSPLGHQQIGTIAVTRLRNNPL